MAILTDFEKNTKYETTAGKEFEKSIDLLPDENIEFIKRGTVITGKIIGQNRGLVVLTNRRIIFVLYHFFSPAKLLPIPLNTISGMNFRILRFLFRGAQRAISLEYDNKSILFAITGGQKPWTGISNPKESIDFFEILKKKLPTCNIDETDISIKAWDYNLSLAGGFIGIFFVFICGILFIWTIPLGYVSGFLIGKVINKFSK